MTLTELRYIVTLAQEQHFGRAAERCHVSQPTLSVGVKKLEDELGVMIFERSKSAVRTTPVGEGIVAQAQKVLESAQGIRELAQVGKNQLAAPLRVGAIYTVGPYLFPHLIPQLHRVAPQMPLYIEENFTHVLRDKLRNGELDAIIIALPFQEADVLTKVLYDEPFTVLMPANHPWSAKATASAIRCWKPARPWAKAAISINTPRWSPARWKPSAIWSPPAWASRCCRCRRWTATTTRQA